MSPNAASEGREGLEVGKCQKPGREELELGEQQLAVGRASSYNLGPNDSDERPLEHEPPVPGAG